MPIQLWSSNANWHFGLIPNDVSREIKEVAAAFRRGFGSVRVKVRIGETTWTTSVFPDAKLECYVLPLKASVRKAEDLGVSSTPLVTLELVDY